MSDYKRFIRDGGKPKANPETKQTIKSDRWDAKRLAQVSEEVKEFVIANKELGEHVDTGFEAMSDTFYALMKAVPKLKDTKEIRPSYLINRAVMEEAMEVSEYEELRQASVGDPICSALACVAMEEPLEAIFDKFKNAQEQAKKLEEMMQQMEALQEEQQTIEELMEAAGSMSSEEEGDYQDQQATIEEQMRMLQEQIDAETEELEQTIEQEMPNAQSAIKAAVEAGNQAVGSGAFDAWGLQPGGLKKLPVGQRLELAKKLNTPKFRKMAEIIGRVQRMAIAEQHNKVVATQDEIYDVSLGNDLSRVLPATMALANDPVFQYDWMRRFVEQTLPQYELQGQERVAKGGIFILEDGSGSMSGEREIYAKAIGLALLKVAMMQKRPFHAVHFGGTGEFKLFSYDTSGHTLKCKTYYKKTTEELQGIEAVVRYAETFYAGGTDFVTPLSVALDKMQEEFKHDGAVASDVVFLTDGQCGVPDSFMKTFKEEQARLGFRVFGINIGGSVKSEPMATICDGNVVVPKDLMGGSDVKNFFAAI